MVVFGIISDFMSIDSENSLFKQLDTSHIPNLIESSKCNKKRRELFFFTEEIRKSLANLFLEFEDCFILDSMPLEICKVSRQNRVKIFKEEFVTAPEKGFCASQNSLFYGYKLHGVCSISGVFLYHSFSFRILSLLYPKFQNEIK